MPPGFLRRLLGTLTLGALLSYIHLSIYTVLSVVSSFWAARKWHWKVPEARNSMAGQCKHEQGQPWLRRAECKNVGKMRHSPYIVMVRVCSLLDPQSCPPLLIFIGVELEKNPPFRSGF
jgi:hypothetical protein